MDLTTQLHQALLGTTTISTPTFKPTDTFRWEQAHRFLAVYDDQSPPGTPVPTWETAYFLPTGDRWYVVMHTDDAWNLAHDKHYPLSEMNDDDTTYGTWEMSEVVLPTWVDPTPFFG